ncbi:hypothetical protein A4R35_01540 [Thermogemmatispora tikiterensis]|uniref:Uncharacterized protein n=1 Tax=Thermogemmatispora tikiterensis TaxID=1825093 RepID=A0A328V982_9CHLR|nr:hypothetical protein A4R35_01540 [Thermogemmatispora tikiterensis]
MESARPSQLTFPFSASPRLLLEQLTWLKQIDQRRAMRPANPAILPAGLLYRSHPMLPGTGRQGWRNRCLGAAWRSQMAPARERADTGQSQHQAQPDALPPPPARDQPILPLVVAATEINAGKYQGLGTAWLLKREQEQSLGHVHALYRRSNRQGQTRSRSLAAGSARSTACLHENTTMKGAPRSRESRRAAGCAQPSNNKQWHHARASQLDQHTDQITCQTDRMIGLPQIQADDECHQERRAPP